MLGCGLFDDDDEGSAVPSDKSGLLSKPEDTSSKAVPGGILPSFAAGDTTSFDGLTTLAADSSYWNDWSYARLVNFRPANLAHGEKRGNAVDPYAAESWEVTPDRLQYTFRLQPEGRLDPRPPTSGRLLDADDVVFAWNRFKAGHRSRMTLAHELDPLAPIESIKAADGRTVVMKLAFPMVSILQALAHHLAGLILMPREADGGFDPRQIMRGSGPWLLTDYQSSIGYKFRRNPNFYRKDRPFLEGIDYPIITEYAQGLAQLKAGGVHTYSLLQEDILPTKADVPNLKMLLNSSYPVSTGTSAVFSFKAGSVFRDERVRQAMSMLIDRDLFIDVRDNTAAFTRAGLPVAQRWSTLLPPGEESFWLDPQGSEFGENAKYFRYDPAEAKNLLQAAGTGVIDQPVTYVGRGFGQSYTDDIEVLRGMWEETGDFKLRPNPVDFATVFAPRYTFNNPRRDFEGKGGIVMLAPADIAEVAEFLSTFYTVRGALSRFEPDFPNDARWDSLVQAQRSEFDEAKRTSILGDLQRYAAEKAYAIHRPGYGLGFVLLQPWVMNAGAFSYRLVNLTGTGVVMQYWLDASKR
jgi:ABC-type transport system substrate-binding protein